MFNTNSAVPEPSKQNLSQLSNPSSSNLELLAQGASLQIINPSCRFERILVKTAKHRHTSEFWLSKSMTGWSCASERQEEKHLKARLHLTLVDSKSLLKFTLKAKNDGETRSVDLFCFGTHLDDYYKYAWKSRATSWEPRFECLAAPWGKRQWNKE